jgi:hypothetical protein
LRQLSEGIRRELAIALETAGWSTALAFAEAVTLQCAYPLGEPPGHQRSASEASAAESVLALLRTAAQSPHERLTPPDTSDGHLERDPILLAAVFQNADLLYRDGFPHADAVALLVMHALAAEG